MFADRPDSRESPDKQGAQLHALKTCMMQRTNERTPNKADSLCLIFTPRHSGDEAVPNSGLSGPFPQVFLDDNAFQNKASRAAGSWGRPSKKALDWSGDDDMMVSFWIPAGKRNE